MTTRRLDCPTPKHPEFFVLLDEEDYEFASAWKWHNDDKGYARRNARTPDGKRRGVFLHREILARKLDRPLSKTEECDHVSRVKHDNTRANLRPATHAQNARNRPMYANNTSGFRGVQLDAQNRKWQAYIQTNGRRHHLGRFATREKAARQGERAALLLLDLRVIDEIAASHYLINKEL